MISITELALVKVREFIANDPEVGHRIRLSARKTAPYRFEYELYFIEADEVTGDDAEQVVEELTFITDPESAENLAGATINFLETPSPGGFKFENPQAKRSFADPLESELNDFIEDVINPVIAAHRGHIALRGIKDQNVYLEMGGSCQGCGMAAMTLRNSVETQIRGRFPDFDEIIDVTNHAEGTSPFYEGAG